MPENDSDSDDGEDDEPSKRAGFKGESRDPAIAPEPEYDPEQEFPDEEADDVPQFPITHEIILKDHTKVVSALALDPSGARIVSGSHDYDCKLWDFGGMDQRCKPFKSWEPSGSYHVCLILYYANSLLADRRS